MDVMPTCTVERWICRSGPGGRICCAWSYSCCSCCTNCSSFVWRSDCFVADASSFAKLAPSAVELAASERTFCAYAAY